jgi:hypothetical protein
VNLLPGLYLAFLAVLLGWALRRFWDPVPLRVWAVFGLVLILLLSPALFGGKVLLPLDILPGIAPPGSEIRGNPLQLDLVTQIVPAMAQVRREVGAGEWPLWNPLAGAGMPLLADPQSQVLQPLVLLAFPLPLPEAVGVIAGEKLLVALVFFFLLLRRQGMPEMAALFGSLSYGMGGFLLLWLGWPISNTAALLPLVLYAIGMTDERGARRDFLLLGIAAFAVLTAGHPETILYGVIVSVLFAGARLLARRENRGRLLGRWAATGAIAFGLAAPALLPLIRYLPQTHREEMVARRNERVLRDPVFAGWESAGAGKRLTSVVAPAAFGDSRAYWGEMNVNEDASAFVGTAALLAALVAFVPGARRFPQERLFLVLAAVALLVIARPPGLPRLLTALPLLDRSPTFHHRIALILAFSLAYLAACTVERWRAGEGRRVAVAVCAVLLGALLLWGYQAWPPPANIPAEVAVARGIQLGALLIAALSLSAFRQRALAVPAVLAVLELFLLFGKANSALPRSWFYPETPAVAFLRENLGKARFVGIGNRLRPNASVLYDLPDIRISNPVKPYLYTRLLAPVSHSVRDINDLLVRPEHSLYHLLGARYVVTPPKIRPRREERRFLRPVLRDRTTWIYERTRVLPVLFLPAAAETPGGRDWAAWVGENPDFAARALVEPSPGRPDRWSAVDPAGSGLDLLPLGPAHLAARARLGEERLLATSVYQDGGWRLLVDGRPRESVLANGLFVAAWLPAGEHRVDVVYRPPGFLFGMLLAALAIAGAVVGAVTPSRKNELGDLSPE